MGALASKVMLGSEIPDPDVDESQEPEEQPEEFCPLPTKLHEGGILPNYPLPGAMCMQLYTPDRVRLEPGCITTIDTRVAVNVPPVLFLETRTLSASKGIAVVQEIYDSSSEGTIHVTLINHNGHTCIFKPGDAVAGLLVQARVVAPDCVTRPRLVVE